MLALGRAEDGSVPELEVNKRNSSSLSVAYLPDLNRTITGPRDFAIVPWNYLIDENMRYCM
jgi:hypothetical protein